MNFAIFNLADIFITVCGILFCVYILFEKPTPEELEAGQGGGLIVMLQNARKGKRSSGRTSHASTRRVREVEEDAFDAVELRSQDEEEPVRRSRSERRRAQEASPLDAIPKRGEHKTLEEELSTIDPDDPFAEWNEGAPSEAPRAAEEPAPAPEAKPEPVESADPLAFDDDLSFDLDSILSEFGSDE